MSRGGAVWGGLSGLVALLALYGCTAKLGGPDQQPRTDECAAPSMLCAGICTDTQSNRGHCGTCDQVCPSNSECLNGSCAATCPSACPTGSECIAGTCAASCLAGQMRCGGACVDVQSSSSHCGGCNSPCATGCSSGVCEPACQGAECQCLEGKERCGADCVDRTTDPKHCGACDNSCSSLESCQAGQCVCAAGLMDCDDACVDLTSDVAHCGDCDTVCEAGSTCVSSACVCSGTLELCEGICTDFDSDDAHCGSCEKACLEGQACEEGQCVAAAADDCGGAVSDAAVSRLALYQAVEIDLYRDGAQVLTAMRKAPVVAGRAALIRGFVEPSTAFQGRSLSLRLRLKTGANERIFFDKRTISGPSVQAQLSSTFQIQVPADAVEPTTEYSVELVDCGTPNPATASKRIPESGSLPLDAEETGSVKIAFVPVTHDGMSPDTSKDALDRYVTLVERQYPISRVEYSVVESIPSGATGTNFAFGDVLEQVALKRYSDDPGPEVYYYGLIKPAASFRQFCNGSCTTGVAFVVQDAGDRSSLYRAGLGVGFDEQVSYTTLPHELGHNHGRDHSPCGVTGDQAFPYQDALIGSWGYDHETQALQNPTALWDFMSYCTPYWVSDFTYDKLATRISGVNGLVANAERTVGTPTNFRALISTPSGVRWTQSMEAVTPPGTPELAVVYDNQGDEIAEVPAFRLLISDEAGFVLFVPPPELGWAAVGPRGGPVLQY